MSKFKVGDKVWVYRGVTAPISGVVTEVNTLSLSSSINTYKVETELTKILGSHGEMEDDLYRNPEENHRLRNKIQDDIIHLEWALEDFLEKTNKDEPHYD